MFRNIYSQLTLFFVMAVFSLSCTIPIRAITTGPQNAAVVPEYFDPGQDILLVVAIPRLDNGGLIDMKSTIKLEEAMQKHYPYQYKVISPKELNESPEKYADTSLYRFALVSERRLVKQPGSFQFDVEKGLAFVPGYKATYMDFAFYDRVTEQRFPLTGTSTTVMRLAVKNLTTMIDKAMEQKRAEKLNASSVLNQKHTQADLSFMNNPGLVAVAGDACPSGGRIFIGQTAECKGLFILKTGWIALPENTNHMCRLRAGVSRPPEQKTGFPAGQ